GPPLESVQNTRLRLTTGLQVPALNHNAARLPGNDQRHRSVNLTLRLPGLFTDTHAERVWSPPGILEMANQTRIIRDRERAVHNRAVRGLCGPCEIAAPRTHVE